MRVPQKRTAYFKTAVSSRKNPSDEQVIDFRPYLFLDYFKILVNNYRGILIKSSTTA